MRATDCPVIVPFHVYVLAPEALNVAWDKEHTVADDGVILKTGTLLVATANVLEDTHPCALVPFTV